MEKTIIKNKKVVLVDGATVIASNGYNIFISNNEGESWRHFARLNDNKYSLISRNRLLSRLFRVEVSEMFVVSGDYYCVAKKAIFKYDKNKRLFKKIFDIEKGSRPINVAVDEYENIYFGEYYSNDDRNGVKVYVKYRESNKFDIIYEFPKKTIRHIHGIYFDKYENKLWFVTGDNDSECIIGYTCDGFKTIRKILHGKQKYRAVKLFFFEEYVIYGTDTPYEINYIYKINRKNYSVCKLLPVEGSIIYGLQINDMCFISTTVEPSKINVYKKTVVYYSKNGLDWIRKCEWEKDNYSMKYFQFGSILFPRYISSSEKIYLYGRAIKKYDNCTIKISVENI